MMMTVSSATAGMTWLDGFLAQAKATSEAARKIAQPLQLPDNATPDQMRAHAADMRRFIEETRQNVNKQIASGNVIGFDAPATAQHNIPETVDGVETGFLKFAPYHAGIFEPCRGSGREPSRRRGQGVRSG